MHFTTFLESFAPPRVRQVRVLAQVLQRSLSIQPNQDALYNTAVSASLVHLVDAPHWSGNSCHQNFFVHSRALSHLKIYVTVMHQTNDMVRLTLIFSVCPSVALPSLLVPLK
jgi:hypothetical protein